MLPEEKSSFKGTAITDVMKHLKPSLFSLENVINPSFQVLPKPWRFYESIAAVASEIMHIRNRVRQPEPSPPEHHPTAVPAGTVSVQTSTVNGSGCHHLTAISDMQYKDKKKR